MSDKARVAATLVFEVEKEEGAASMTIMAANDAAGATEDAVRDRLFGEGFLPADVTLVDDYSIRAGVTVEGAQAKVSLSLEFEAERENGDFGEAEVRDLERTTKTALKERLFGDGFLADDVTLVGQYRIDVQASEAAPAPRA